MRNMNLRMLALAVMVVCLPALSRAATPQEATEAKQAEAKESIVYRVEYTVREFEDGKRLNSRTYSTVLSPDPRPGRRTFGRIRVGSSVPTGLAEAEEKRGIDYRDVGINIDCQLGEQEKGVALSTNFESSYVPAGAEGATRVPGAPIIRQVRFMADSFVTLSRPTVISTLDDVMTNRRYEIEVTVTKVK